MLNTFWSRQQVFYNSLRLQWAEMQITAQMSGKHPRTYFKSFLKSNKQKITAKWPLLGKAIQMQLPSFLKYFSVSVTICFHQTNSVTNSATPAHYFFGPKQLNTNAKAGCQPGKKKWKCQEGQEKWCLCPIILEGSTPRNDTAVMQL